MTKTKSQKARRAGRVAELSAVAAGTTAARTSRKAASHFDRLAEELRRSIARSEVTRALERDRNQQELMRLRRERDAAIEKWKAHYEQMYSYSFRKQSEEREFY